MNHLNTAVSRRLTWDDVTPFPGNPIYEGRLRTMEKDWDGYNHAIIGTPELIENVHGIFPDLPSEALINGDANHRQELARRHGFSGYEFVAKINRPKTRSEVFKLRRGWAGRRTVRPSETFLALAEENPLGIERQIKDEIEGLGWHISYVREDLGLSCTNELKWVFKQSKEALIAAVLTYQEVFGTKAAWRGQSYVIKGLGAFWVLHPDADKDRLIRSLKGITVQDLYESGRSTRESTTFIKSVGDGVRYSLVQSYNRQARKGHLPVA